MLLWVKLLGMAINSMENSQQSGETYNMNVYGLMKTLAFGTIISD